MSRHHHDGTLDHDCGPVLLGIAVVSLLIIAAVAWWITDAYLRAMGG